MKSTGKALRKLIARPQGAFAYGIFDAMSARVAEMAGVEAIYYGGYAAHARRCLPDMEIITMTEMLDDVRWISPAVNLPILVDIEEGWGGVHNVRRAVNEFLSLPNVAAVHLEDQRTPKRCGHIAGKEVLPLKEFLGKLKAALDERDRVAPDRIIIARTDAFHAAGAKEDPRVGGDIKESLKRGLAYADLGADLVWCEFPSPDLASAEAFAEGMRRHFPQLPLAFNISPSFKVEEWAASPLADTLLEEMGYRFRFATYPAELEAMLAVYRSARRFVPEATVAMRNLKRSLVGSPVESVKEVVGVDRYQKIERKYDPGAEERLRTSKGFGEIIRY